jgi:hypothetical protein
LKPPFVVPINPIQSNQIKSNQIKSNQLYIFDAMSILIASFMFVSVSAYDEREKSRGDHQRSQQEDSNREDWSLENRFSNH